MGLGFRAFRVKVFWIFGLGWGYDRNMEKKMETQSFLNPIAARAES